MLALDRFFIATEFFVVGQPWYRQLKLLFLTIFWIFDDIAAKKYSKTSILDSKTSILATFLSLPPGKDDVTHGPTLTKKLRQQKKKNKFKKKN